MLSALLFATLLSATPVKETGYIYLGDSRFVGMDKVCEVSEEDNTWVVAKVGEGLNWCKKTAVPEIAKIVEDNPDVDEWVLISGLGVNDTYNAKKYVEFYENLDDMTIVLCSVNPVEKSKCDKHGYDYSYLSKGIESVNAVLQDSDFPYIDVNSYLIENGYETADGVHYTADTYTDIYVYIGAELELILDETKE